jgi:hypothetical protein
VVSLSQRPLTDITQHLQQTDIHAPGWIRIHDISRRAAVDLPLRPRGHWDRQYLYMCELFVRVKFVYKITTACVNLLSRIRSPFTAAVPNTCAAYTHYVVAQEHLYFTSTSVYLRGWNGGNTGTCSA